MWPGGQRWAALGLAGVLVFGPLGGPLYAAAPPAGITIQNISTMTYTSAGQRHELRSNVFKTTVLQVRALILTANQTKSVAPGGSVSFPHILINTGNGEDTISLSLAQGTGDQFNFSNLGIFPDVNGDGVADAGAAAITTVTGLASGATFNFVVSGTVPSTAVAGDVGIVEVLAETFDRSMRVKNTDTVQVTEGAIINVTKAVSSSSGLPGSGPHTYTLTYKNVGARPARDFKITDSIPAGMNYVPGSGRWSLSGGTVLTDAAGDEQGNTPDTLSYDFNAGTQTLTVMIFSVPSSGVSSTGTITFRVTVDGGVGPRVLLNTAEYAYDSLGGFLSNTADFQVLKRVGGEFSLDPVDGKAKGDTILSATVGRTIHFDNVFTNEGNTSNTFDIEQGKQSFPPGTTFRLFRDGGGGELIELFDTDGNGKPDTGLLAPGESFTVYIKVTLPLKGSGGPFSMELKATSTTKGPSGEDVTDTAINTLVKIGDPVLKYYTPDYKVPITHTRLGNPLFLQTDALGCNVSPTQIDAGNTTIRDGVIILTSKLTGDTEEFVATESGPNTGLFRILPFVETEDSAVPKPGDKKMQLVKNDKILAKLQGCETTGVEAEVLIDPAGIVFDSKTNAPIPGVTVTLIDVTGAGNGGLAGQPAIVKKSLADGSIVPAPSTVVTGVDGLFEFPLVEASRYKLVIIAPNGHRFPSTVPIGELPAGRRIDPSGSYGGEFAVTEATGPVFLDVPLDPIPASGLFIDKKASRTVAEIADLIDYTVAVKNDTGVATPLTLLHVDDVLPAGFTYQTGTARRNGVAIADPTGGAGPKLSFSLGSIANGETVTLTYRVGVGPGALQGDGTNKAQAFSGVTESNRAQAVVKVQGGVFSSEGYIVGKVFLDCNRNRRQEPSELGIPGVRVFLEDGTSAISDSEGKYSFYGIRSKTHVLKLDYTSMPRGSELIDLSHRNALDAGSQFVDLKDGQINKANFAEGSCGEGVVKEVKRRRDGGEVFVAETDRGLSAKMPTEVDRPVPADPKSLPASGVLGEGTRSSRFESVVPEPVHETLTDRNSLLPKQPIREAPTFTPSLEEIMAGLTSEVGFINLRDKDILPVSQTQVRVKGSSEFPFRLTLNGDEIPVTRVGKRIASEQEHIAVLEYIGVDLKAGENLLEVSQSDGEKIVGSQAIRVIAPGQLGRIVIEAPESVPADGHAPAEVIVRLMDANGVPVTVRTPVTLEASLGRLQVEDVDSVEPNVQVFIEGGRSEYLLLAPQVPGEGVVRALSGTIRSEARVSFIPDVRPMVAVGIIEGTVNFNNFDSRDLVPAHKADGFEDELRHLTSGSDDDRSVAGGRAALFLKGKIRGNALLTMGYDSDKETRERLFRDIQPDEFYPVYGDSSIREYDAQSTQRFYIRVDKNRSYAMYGDFTTQSSGEVKNLGRYNRNLTGVRVHGENGQFNLNAFASRDSLRHVIDLIPGKGISGPYFLSDPAAIPAPNSEQVEIVTYDRNQPSVTLKTQRMVRFNDYTFDEFSRSLLFRRPIPSVDENLNPVVIRVTYEADQGGKDFWVAGLDGQLKVTDRVELGFSSVDENNPQDDYQLRSGNISFRLGEKTYLIGEGASSHKSSVGSGSGVRTELRHQGERLQARLHSGRTDADFVNPSSGLAQGRMESGLQLTYKMTPRNTLRVEGLQSRDVRTGGERTGLSASVEKHFDNNVRIETGVRHSKETPTPASTVSSVGEFSNTSLRIKVGAQIPTLPQLNVFGEYEQDTDHFSRCFTHGSFTRGGAQTECLKAIAVGGDYQFASRGRVYARHEFVSSIGGRYVLTPSQTQHVTLFGVDTNYMRDGHLFTEYRARDAFSGRETDAAIGLRNLWHLAEGLRMNTSYERTKTLDSSSPTGGGGADGTAVAIGLEYTPMPLWKGTARVERRWGRAGSNFLGSVGLARKLDRDWTFLAKNTFFVADSKDAGSKRGERLQAGLAYRDTDTDVWNALGKYEFKREADSTVAGLTLRRSVHILSMHLHYQPSHRLQVSGRYATKWVKETSNDLYSKNNANLISGRLTYDMKDRWDIGLIARDLFEGDTHQYGLGAEVGYLADSNVWLSGGYNLLGFSDDDLTGQDYTDKGTYFRVRLKFDEDLFSDRLTAIN